MKVASLMKRKLPSEDTLEGRPSPRDVTAYRAWLKASPLDEKIEELRSRRRETQDRILAAETDGAKRGQLNESQTRVERRAKSLIGEAKVAVVDETASLDSLFEERAAIDKALTVLSERRTDEFLQKISNELMLRRDEGRELAYRRAQWALEGRRLHAESEAFRASFAGAPTGSPFPGSDVSLAPLFAGGGICRRAIEAALRAAVITKTEVEK